jgi:hypothetical protein
MSETPSCKVDDTLNLGVDAGGVKGREHVPALENRVRATLILLALQTKECYTIS